MSANSTEATTELVVCGHASIGHLVESPEESVVCDPLSRGEVAEESVTSEQNVALGLGECERKAVRLGECGVAILVGQSDYLAGGVEFDDPEAKKRKVDIELSTQFEGVHLIGNRELPGETEERLQQAASFQIQQDGGVGDDDASMGECLDAVDPFRPQAITRRRRSTSSSGAPT